LLDLVDLLFGLALRVLDTLRAVRTSLVDDRRGLLLGLEQRLDTLRLLCHRHVQQPPR